jgi:tetrapyrrole methylase family protein/MazG family protein/ATP diphosphatase
MTEWNKASDPSAQFSRLIEVIRTLRSENGCPWDKKQTPESFHPYILEEYHEMVQAINEGDVSGICDELGDLIFLVLFVAYMFDQQGITSLSEIFDCATTKMIRRHPHVFGNETVKDAQGVIDRWAEIKASEENIRKRESFLDGVPRSLPALSRAQKLAKRAAKVGFDWTRPEEVFPKIQEELGELREAVSSGSPGEIREELGDLLFVTVNAARHLQVNSESALADTSDKFERRFRYIEKQLKARNRSLHEATLEEMDELWDEAKALEKQPDKEDQPDPSWPRFSTE